MAVQTISAVFLNYLKLNIIIPKVFYIQADEKTKSPYVTIQQTDSPLNNTFLCEDKQGETRFLVSLFHSSYTKGINAREDLMEYIVALRTQTNSGFETWDVTVENSWDNEKNYDRLYSFNMEVLIKWTKTS